MGLDQIERASEIAETSAYLLSAAFRQSGDDQQRAEIAARFGHWRIDVATWTIAWSAGVARIFGRPMPPGGALDLDSHLEFYHPRDRLAVRSRIERAITGQALAAGSGYHNRGGVVQPDGTLRDVMAQGIAVFDDHGQVCALHGIVLDVTDAMRFERDAQEAAETLRVTLENMDQGLVMLGPDERVRVHNRRARDLLGLSSTLLHHGAPFDAIRRHQLARGEFDHSSAEMDGWTDGSGLERTCVTHERQRPDGRTLEVRAVPLADGGVVRTFTDVTEQRQAERAVKESEQRFRLLAEHTSDVIIWVSLDMVRHYVSPAVKSVLGYEPEDLVGTRALELAHPDDVEDFRCRLNELTRGLIHHITTQKRYRRKDGAWVWLEITCNLTFDADGTRTGYVSSLRNISDRKAVEDALRISEERLALALASGSDGFWDWNVASGEVSVSEHWLTMLGYARDDIDPHIRMWPTFIHPDDAQRSRSAFAQHVRGSAASYECEYRFRTKRGDYLWILARGKVVSRDARGRALRVVGTHIDITQRKEAEQAIAHMALHDALTDLPNRNLFRDRLNQELINAERYGYSFAVLACDLDRFKAINDTHGHAAGDEVLRIVAKRLNGAVRECDTVARLGGDEFAIILGRLNQPAEASLVAQRLIEAIEAPIEIEGHALNISLSVGIAIGPDDGRVADLLFRNADIALYRAKAAGRNTFCFFETGMDTVVAERNMLERDIRDTVKRGGFVLHYQPVLALATGEITGFEALLRWQHPVRGAIPPAEFIPMAEEIGLIETLGDWALREACRRAAQWPGTLRIAVNVSAVQFQRPDRLKRSVLMALSSSGLAPDRLELEITESVMVADAAAAIACLTHLRDVGVRVALDDFGTGYSGLSYLRRFPFDKIKIDRAFIHDIENPDTAAIVRAVVGLGARAGADVTAEGVETKDQLERVRREGCTEVQGFLLGRPLAADDASRLIRRTRVRVAA